MVVRDTSTLVARALRLLGELGGRVCIGVTGPPAAGKSLLSAAIVSAIAQRGISAMALPMDGFHMTNAALAERGLTPRKGAAETFEASALVDRLKAVASGGVDVGWPEYSRVSHDPIPDAIVVPSGVRLVVVEGNYLGLADRPWREVRPLLAELWFVDGDVAAFKDRLLRRHLSAGMAVADAWRHIDDVDLTNMEQVRSARASATIDVELSPEDPLLRDVVDPATSQAFALG